MFTTMVIQNYMSSFPIIDNTYLFECTKCGNCCIGDIRITLNPYDLYKMAHFLKMKSTCELFDQNYVCLFKHHEHNVWLPEILFKTSPLKFCPFLINDADDKNYIQGLCSLHPEYKPVVCSMAPVGRILDFEEFTDQFAFLRPAPDCPGVEEQKENHISEDIAAFSDELNLQNRFFRILEQLNEVDYSKEYYQENIYQFNVDLDFYKIIKSIEDKLIQSDIQ